MADPWQKRLFEAASGAGGLVTLNAAAAAGLTRRHLLKAVRCGLLLSCLPGVYRVAGPPITRHQQLLSAQLWAGCDSALSHWSAAEVHEIDLPGRHGIHVTTCKESKSPFAAITVHSRAFLPAHDIMVIRGVRATEPMRTLIDLAAAAAPSIWETALDSFLRRGMALDSFVSRFESTAERGRNGTRMIRRLLQERRSEAGVPENGFERLLLRALRRYAVPAPVAQHWVTLRDGRRVRLDFAYPDERVAVEAQSYTWHSDRESWERDRARSSELASLGWLVVEVTWKQLHDDPEGVALRVAQALKAHSFGNL